MVLPGRRRTFAVRTKIIAGVMGIVLLMGLPAIVLIRAVLAEKIEAELHKRGVSIARHLAAEALSPILTEDYLSLRLNLKNRQSVEEDVTYIFVTDPDGKVLGHTFENLFPKGLKEANRVLNGQDYSIQPIMANGDYIYDIAVPVEENKTGIVRIGISGRSVEDGVSSVTNTALWTLAWILIMASGFIVIFVDLAVTKPIIKLAKTAGAIESGQLDQRVEIKSRDEIGHLGEMFNSMVEKLVASHKKLVENHSALKMQEAKFRQIVESSPMGIQMYRLEADGKLVLVGANPAADDILGINHQRLQEKTFEEAFPALAKTEAPQRYRRVCATGKSWYSDHFKHKRNREVIILEIFAFQPSPGQATVQFMDITEKERLRKEVLEAKDRLIEEMRRNEQHLSEIAHRLRNPLQVLMGHLALVDPSDFPPELREFFISCRSNVAKIEDGIKKLT